MINTLIDSSPARESSAAPVVNTEHNLAQILPVSADTIDNRDSGGTSQTSPLREPGITTPLTPQKQRKLVTIPPELRRPEENDQSEITRTALYTRRSRKKRCVPIPDHLRKPTDPQGATMHRSSLKQRTLVPVPIEYRIAGETRHSKISIGALKQRKRTLVPIPIEYRIAGETNDSKISKSALQQRKSAARKREEAMQLDLKKIPLDAETLALIQEASLKLPS